MPPRRFPLPLRVGIDICQVSRIHSIIARHEKRKSFIRKLLTTRERKYFAALFYNKPDVIDIEPGNVDRVAKFLAGRWSAKEACIKAMKPRKLTLQEIEIWPEPDKESYAIILDARLDQEDLSAIQTDQTNSNNELHRNEEPELSRRLVPSHEDVQGQIARLSISHDGDYASAVAIVAVESDGILPSMQASAEERSRE